MTSRIRVVFDQAGQGQAPILDFASGQRPVLSGTSATAMAIGAPGAHVKNLGPGTVFVRSDGLAAANNSPQCYPLDQGEEWDFWFAGDTGTLSLFGSAGATLSVIPYDWISVG